MTLLDGYPLPKIHEIEYDVSPFSIYSMIDLKNAYHQVELAPNDKIFTAFEAGAKFVPVSPNVVQPN